VHQKFTNRYISSVKKQLDLIDHGVISTIINKINYCRDVDSTIYVIGNGGSAATASHMQNDLGVGLKRRGVLDVNITSLCDNLAVMTALANDIGYENIFYAQLKNKIKKEDFLIAISCSGNSINIIKAVQYAQKFGATVLGMTGFDGGKLKELSDINYHIETKKEEYGLVEDLHMMLDHMIYTYYIEKED